MSIRGESILWFRDWHDHFLLFHLCLGRGLVYVGSIHLPAQLVIELVKSFRKQISSDAYSLNDHTGDLVGVAVGCRPAVLEIALAIFCAFAVDTD